MYTINTPSVLHDFIDDEVIIVNLEHGYYFSLSGISAFVWRAINDGYNINDIGSCLKDKFKVNLDKFIEELKNEGLIIATSDISNQNTDLIKLKDKLPANSTNELKLDRYTDMQEFLLLDPIHDINDAGWPNKK